MKNKKKKMNKEKQKKAENKFFKEITKLFKFHISQNWNFIRLIVYCLFIT